MAASTENHDADLDLEILVGTYEQVLFGYKLIESDNKALLKLSITDKSHCASIRSLAVSNHGILASGAADETIFLFNLRKRTEFGTLMKHTGTVTHIEFYSKFMISSDESGMICIWKTGNNFECLKTLKAHNSSITSMSVHPSGKLLLSVGQDKTLRTWNLITAKRAYTTNTKAPVDIVQWTPVGDHYVLAYNGQLEVCSVANAGVVHSVKLPGKGHAMTFVFDNIVAVACEGGVLVFVNVHSGEICNELKVEDSNRVKSVSSQRIENNCSMMVLVTSEGHIQLHMVKVEDEQVEATLVAATKTSLRPVCAKLVVHSKSVSHKLSDNQPITDEVKGETCSQATEGSPHKKAIKKRKADDDKQMNEKDYSPDQEKKKKLESGKPLKQLTLTSEKEKEKKMDKLKKHFTNSDSKSVEKNKLTTQEANGVQDTRHGLSKKHKRPVDSMKIIKKKMESHKHVQKAKHHHVHSEEADTDT